jgi:hypothetical protein
MYKSRKTPAEKKTLSYKKDGSCGVRVQKAFSITHALHDGGSDALGIFQRLECRNVIRQVAFMDETKRTQEGA